MSPTASEVTTSVLRAERDDAGDRLDRFVARRLAAVPGVSRTRVRGWVEAGCVRLEGAPVAKASSRLKAGDEVVLELPGRRPERRSIGPQEMPLRVLFEDEHLLAVDKPADLVCHPTPAHRAGTLLNGLLALGGWQEGCLPGLVSRLDRGTSGVVLVARRGEVHAALARALRARGALKEYLAVVYGRTPVSKDRVDLRIDRDPADRRRRRASRSEGRPASTLYERRAESPGGELTLLACRLLTGRTHQIRVHLAARGLPLVGDPLYGAPGWRGIADRTLARCCRAFPRQALHAHRLVVDHPVTGRRLEIEAPVPRDLEGLLAAASLAG